MRAMPACQAWRREARATPAAMPAAKLMATEMAVTVCTGWKGGMEMGERMRHMETVGPVGRMYEKWLAHVQM